MKLSSPTAAPKLPTNALAIARPADPPKTFAGKDISEDSPAVLSILAQRQANVGKFQNAAQCQFWVVQSTNEGRYDLACWEALAGEKEKAMYWLQKTGEFEGINTKWALQDPDLNEVRADPRWPKLLEYLRGCETYWRVAGPKQTLVLVPASYDGKKEIPLVVWLHGMGANPAQGRSMYQSLADKHQIAFVGVSGTLPTGKTHFAWADVAEEDYDRIRLSLAEVREKVRWREGTAVALGFSQGGMVAVEVAVRHPEAFAGAIAVSAGTGSPVQLNKVADKTALPRQGYVIVCGAKENIGSVFRSRLLENWLKGGKAKVLFPSYPNHSQHSFPDDFEERLPEWLAYVAAARESP